mgnify:CR=1 FL=1
MLGDGYKQQSIGILEVHLESKNGLPRKGLRQHEPVQEQACHAPTYKLVDANATSDTQARHAPVE